MQLFNQASSSLPSTSKRLPIKVELIQVNLPSGSGGKFSFCPFCGLRMFTQKLGAAVSSFAALLHFYISTKSCINKLCFCLFFWAVLLCSLR
jgi:hypothetical protein